MRVLVALVLCAPLGGCFSLTGPAPLPEWAMNPQQQVTSETRVKPRRAVVRREAVEPREVDVADRTGAVGIPTNERPANLAKDRQAPRASAAQTREPTAFSAEWQARENAADEKLRRSMHICRGC